jgi:Ca2+/Na+ antiporter
VLIFADPAVEVMTEIAFRINVNPFYVSFILAPLASNASEVIASFNYAKKKTAKSIQIALTTLEGAACLNNTFCLAVFLAIVGFRNLEWTFTAEVTAILFVQFAVGAIVLWRQKTFLVSDGYIIVALYPISIALVALLK